MERQDLFFAFRPDGDVGEDIEAYTAWVRHQYDLTGRPTPSERLHATLAAAGSYDAPRGQLPRDILLRANAAGDIARGATRPFEITFDRLGEFGGDSIVIYSTQIPDAAAALQQTLTRALGPSQNSFTPHITLLYDSREVPNIILEKPITLHVNKLELIDSFYGKTHHQTLTTWHLR